eukprot:6479161-Amphidinium_carterae.1
MTAVLQPALGQTKFAYEVQRGCLRRVMCYFNQRFKSVETAAAEGSWDFPPTWNCSQMRVSSLGTAEQSVALVEGKEEAKLKKDMASSKPMHSPRGGQKRQQRSQEQYQHAVC